jgi:phosphoenolpyruvate carboxylase
VTGRRRERAGTPDPARSAPPSSLQPPQPATAEAWSQWCLDRLSNYESEFPGDPLTNSVRRLAYDLSIAESEGALDRSRLSAIGKVFCDRALAARVEDFNRRHDGPEIADADFAGRLFQPLDGRAFDDVAAAMARPRAGIVFTAHPTFALSADAAQLFAAPPRSASHAERHARSAPPTLFEEHEAATAAILRAQDAVRALIQGAFVWGRERFPDDWTRLAPAPLTLATWVGYDLDGRTDIHWGATFRFRLEEKAAQLSRYAADLGRAGPSSAGKAALAARLKRASALAARQASLFAADLSEPANVIAAANALSSEDEDRLTSLEAIVNETRGLAAEARDDDARLALLVLAAEMRLFGLGLAHVHLRINAAQIASALRSELGLDNERDILERSVLDAAADRTETAATRRVNFASIFRERMTARRQMMLCAELIKHVDADAPIRFLIAESEAPATVMGAVYLARQYGVDGKIDISPLFETPEAIERGGRFMERLLAEPAFADYARRRGRVAIQAGFSDSGRFMGQAAANLAIERLQILCARAMSNAGLNELEAVVFNTHGESLGRGGYLGPIGERFDYLMTPWARARYAHERIPLCAETSFQGGDGFLHFLSPERARQTVRALALWGMAEPARDANDRYYSDINYSWDFYRGVKAWQEDLFQNPDYERAVASFGPGFLIQSGSRRARRPKDAIGAGLKTLRAIPHNAILQQLAAPANVWGGVGAAAGMEADRLIELTRGSPRVRSLIKIVRRARAMTSMPALRAYAALFDPSFWISKAAGSQSPTLAWRCEELARQLAAAPVANALNRLADHLSADLLRLDSVLAALDGEASAAARRKGRLEMHAVHAVRQAMIIRAFLLVASLPAFSSRHDATRADLFELAFELKFDALADLLEEIFPASPPDVEAFAALAEPGDDADSAPRGYPEIHREVVAPLRAISSALKEIGVGLSHYYGAYG